jgi:hypothetical protein
MPGDQPPPGDANRRVDLRTDILGDVRGEIMVYQPMIVRQISRTGAVIETAFPLHIDSLHDIRLSLAAAPVVVKVRVVHCTVTGSDSQSLGYVAGLEFVEPTPAVRLAIAHFIDALKSADWSADDMPQRDAI